MRASSCIPLTIVRPALVGWSRQSPVPNPSDWLTSLMFSCLCVGAVPKSKQRFTVLPVDECASAIVLPLQHDHLSERVIHLAHTQSFAYKQLFESLRRVSGLALPVVPFADWIGKLRVVAEKPGKTQKSLSAALLILGGMTDLPVDRVHDVVAAERLGVPHSAPLGPDYIDGASKFVLDRMNA